MYSYFYDVYLNARKYESTLAQVEGRLVELQINGKITRLTILNHFALGEWLQGEWKRGVKTIIAVGNDHTLNHLIHFPIPHYGVVGFIPIGGGNTMASFLHIPEGLGACDVISRRLLKRLDLGFVNDHFFLTKLQMSLRRDMDLFCDEAWNLHVSKDGILTLFNAGVFPLTQERIHRANGEDGVLEGVFTLQGQKLFSSFPRNSQSVFFFKKARLSALESFSLTYDGEKFSGHEAIFGLAPKKIKVIVGSGV
jgi:hypothetical protein